MYKCAQFGLQSFKHCGLLFIPHYSALFLRPYLLPNGFNLFRGLYFPSGHSPFFLRFLFSSLLVYFHFSLFQFIVYFIFLCFNLLCQMLSLNLFDSFVVVVAGFQGQAARAMLN